MLKLFSRRAAMRGFVLALVLGATIATGTVRSVTAQHPYSCQPGHYDVIVPGYVGVPAAVDVSCFGSMTTMDVQWPFDDPSPQAWHNRYELNAADATVSITVGGEWLCTLQWLPNEGGTTRYVIAGCPEVYGGDGTPVPWGNPCIQKVRNRIYPDFWIFRNVVAQNGSSAVRTLSRMLAGIGQGDDAGGFPSSTGEPRDDSGPQRSGELVDSGAPTNGTTSTPPRPRSPRPSDAGRRVSPGHSLEPPDTDLLERLERPLRKEP